MKKAALTFLQFFVFLFVFFIGSFMKLPHPFHYERIVSSGPEGVHIFIGDGLHLMILIYILILILELVTRRFRSAAAWTTLALLLATAVGFMLRFGYITHSAY